MIIYEEAICRAVREKRLLTFVYEMKQRTIEPHVYAHQKDGDDLVLGGWQLFGGSGVGWRDFLASKLSAPSATDSHFLQPRSIYKRNAPSLGRVICEL